MRIDIHGSSPTPYTRSLVYIPPVTASNCQDSVVYVGDNAGDDIMESAER